MSGPGLCIQAVEQLWPWTADGRQTGYLEQPFTSQRLPTYHLAVSGWVAQEQIRSLAIRVRGSQAVELLVDQRRPDIASAFGERFALSGFAAEVDLMGSAQDTDVELIAADSGGTISTMARVTLRREPLSPDRAMGPAPLMISSLGRSGTSWLSALLGSHPAILTYLPMEAEPRLAAYWSRTFSRLLETSRAREELNLWDPRLEALMAADELRAVGEFCRRRVEVTCLAMAHIAGKDGHSRYFTEKCEPANTPWTIWTLFPDGREILLVRDLRDILTSVLAFNKKRGRVAFGREHHPSDESYVADIADVGTALSHACAERRDRSLVVRYEDLVRDTETELTRILAYLDLERDQTTVTSICRDVAEGNAQRQHGTSPDAHASVGRWKVDLAPSLRRVCDEVLAEPLVALGYEP